MTFEQQTLGGLFRASDLTSELLLAENIRSNPLTLAEALCLQAASHLIAEEDAGVFICNDIASLIRFTNSTVYKYVKGFVEIDLIEAVGSDRSLFYQGRPPVFYAATEIGERVLSLFQFTES